jgi:hypothetical protein
MMEFEPCDREHGSSREADGARESGWLSFEAESKVIGHGFALDAAKR